MSSTLNIHKWITFINKIKNSKHGLSLSKRDSYTSGRSVSEWTNSTLKISSFNIWKLSATFHGCGITKFNNNSYPYFIDIAINGFNVFIKKHHINTENLLCLNTIEYKGYLNSNDSPYVSIVSITRGYNHIGYLKLDN